MTVTLVDGFVLARSAFHHSVNYRSVVVFGTPELVEGPDKVDALDAIVEQLVPGRVDSLRPMTDKEIAGTTVLRLGIDEASAKVRHWHLERFLHLLPGVRRHPELEEHFIVDTRYARWLARELFHLLGFKRRGKATRYLVMARRLYHRKKEY